MSTQELKARARRLAEEVYGQGDLAAAEELISPDYVHHVPGAPPEPGFAGIKRWVHIMRAAFPDLHVIVEDEIAEEDRVAQRLSVRGTHKEESSGVPSGRGIVSFEVIDINRAGHDGRFVEHWSSMDLLGVIEQLGGSAAGKGIGSSSRREP